MTRYLLTLCLRLLTALATGWKHAHAGWCGEDSGCAPVGRAAAVRGMSSVDTKGKARIAELESALIVAYEAMERMRECAEGKHIGSESEVCFQLNRAQDIVQAALAKS